MSGGSEWKKWKEWKECPRFWSKEADKFVASRSVGR